MQIFIFSFDLHKKRIRYTENIYIYKIDIKYKIYLQALIFKCIIYKLFDIDLIIGLKMDKDCDSEILYYNVLMIQGSPNKWMQLQQGP